MTVSDEIFNRAADRYRRIRNTGRYLLANLNGFNPETDMVAIDELVELDRWILARAAELQAELVQSYNSYKTLEVTQKLMNFCTGELGSFYLDVIKDRQYTAKSNSHARRSCQTALYHIAEALTRWMAPIMSFTAQEIWELLPGTRSQYVFTETWYSVLDGVTEGKVSNDVWQTVLEVRDEVNRVLENARKEEKIGSALQAEVTLYTGGELAEALSLLGDELRFVLLTSKANVEVVQSKPEHAVGSEIDGLFIAVNATSAEKCERCWHYCDDVGAHEGHETICGRCVSNVDGDGEARQFA
jgi:isoleucyl-tRNA synthetase